MTRRFLAQLTLGFAATFVAGPAVVRAETGKVRRNVEIEFEAIEGATAYEVKVTRKDGDKKPTTFKLKKPRWSADIKPGPYVMQLRAFDDRGVPGDWSPPSDLIVKLPALTVTAPSGVIGARRDDKDEVDFKWEPVAQARSYRVDVHAAPGDFHDSFTSSRSSLRASLPVAAAYEWTVVAIDEDKRDGDVGEKPNAFTLRGPALEKPRPEPPLSRFVDHVAWPSVDHADAYESELRQWDKKTKTWIVVPGPANVVTNEYPLDISRPTGRYKLSLVATGANRLASRRAELTFFAEGGFTDKERMHDAQLRDSLFKPAKYYAIMSLLPSTMNYQSTYAETNSRVAYSGMGVTARVGAGYQKRESVWGGFVIADFGRLSVQNAAFTSESAEAHATYKMNVGHRGIALIGAGVFLKQLPLIIGSPVYGFENLGKISEMGPHVGASYDFPLTDRWGLRADARLYYAASGSTGGGALSGSTAYQAQLLGTYRYGRNWTLIGGIGERHDEANWAAQPGPQSFARPGITNSVKVDGTYFNLSAEFSF